MPMLIWGFAGRKYHIVGNLMSLLKSILIFMFQYWQQFDEQYSEVILREDWDIQRCRVLQSISVDWYYQDQS